MTTTDTAAETATDHAAHRAIVRRYVDTARANFAVTDRGAARLAARRFAMGASDAACYAFAGYILRTDRGAYDRGYRAAFGIDGHPRGYFGQPTTADGIRHFAAVLFANRAYRYAAFGE